MIPRTWWGAILSGLGFGALVVGAWIGMAALNIGPELGWPLVGLAYALGYFNMWRAHRRAR